MLLRSIDWTAVTMLPQSPSVMHETAFNTDETLHPGSRGNLRRRVVVFTSNSLMLMNPWDYNAL